MASKIECREWGFDLTDFRTADKFKGILNRHGMTKFKKECETESGSNIKYCKFTWKNKGLKIVTGNNPITGEYTRKGREPQKGYASYIGIEGDPKKVESLAKDIKRSAKFIKDESKCRRDFI